MCASISAKTERKSPARIHSAGVSAPNKSFGANEPEIRPPKAPPTSLGNQFPGLPPVSNGDGN